MTEAIPELYRHDQFVARRQVFRLFGAGFTISTLDGRPLASSEQKAFRFKEDIRVVDGAGGGPEILQIKADRIIDFSAAYRVTDSQTGEAIGTIRRKGWTSMFRDSWEILDPSGIVRGRVTEDGGWKAAARRLVELASLLFPETLHIEVEGWIVGTMRQNFNPFVQKYFVDLTHDADGILPRQLAVATVILLLAVEGRQGWIVQPANGRPRPSPRPSPKGRGRQVPPRERVARPGEVPSEDSGSGSAFEIVPGSHSSFLKTS